MKNMKKFLVMLLAMSMAASMAACSTPAQKQEAAPAATEAAEPAAEGETAAAEAEAEATATEGEGQKIFRYTTTVEAASLDPIMANSINENEIAHSTILPLVRATGGSVECDGAESYEVNEDGTVYTFKVRQGMKWSDGVEVKAQDYVYGLQRLANPETGSPYAWSISGVILNASEISKGEAALDDLGVKALDDYTVEITLCQNTPYFLAMMGASAQYAPQRQDIVEQYGKDFAATAEKNVYAGPYMLTSSENQTYVFEKNPNYWNVDALHLDKTIITVVPDTATAIAMYENGELDYSAIPNEQVANYEGIDNVFMNGNCDFLYINSKSETQPLLQDTNFRLALNYAMNRTAYIALATNNVYLPSTHATMPLVSGVNASYGEEYFDTNKIEGYPVDGDTELAKEYLQKAMDAAGIANASDITLNIIASDGETNKKILEVCKEIFEQNLGINVAISQVTYGSIWNDVYAVHDFEVGYGGWGPDYDDPYTYLGLWQSDIGYAADGGNYSNYNNPDYDALLKACITETDAQKRMDMLAEAENILLADGALIPLQNRSVHYMIDEDVTGVVFHFMNVNIDWVYADCAPTVE